MKKLFFSIAVFLIVILITTTGYSQERMLRGQVFTFDSIPLINAQIKIKSTKQVVNSDTTGRFSVLCNADDILYVSARGFYKQKVKLEDKTKLAIINLKLKPGEKSKEIAVGYGYVKDQDKLNAAVSLSNDEMDFSKYRNLYEVISGRFPGVQIANDQIIIRGEHSINGSSAALIIVDGMPSDNSILSTLPPIQVKSINIVKDGSASIYGAQSANGVILIETRKGGDN